MTSAAATTQPGADTVPPLAPRRPVRAQVTGPVGSSVGRAGARRAGGSVRVRPAPRREPPFDDELDAIARHLVGMLDRPLPFDVGRRQPFEIVSPRRSGLPDPHQWGRRLIIGIVEAAAGRRPLNQLGDLLSPSISRGLRTEFERAQQARRPHWTHSASLRTLRASEPVDGVAELCAVMQTPFRVRAIALRAEAYHGRWRCTRLQLG